VFQRMLSSPRNFKPTDTSAWFDGMQMQRSRTLTWLGLSFLRLAIYCFGAGLLSPSYSQDASAGADIQGRGFGLGRWGRVYTKDKRN
jgi:hypothetical protein